MQISDTLCVGGAERVAVNLSNYLPRDRYRSYLCTTRDDGPLEEFVDSSVGRLRLARRSTMDLFALNRLVRFIARHDIRILHAHGPSLFITRLAAMFPPRPSVVWHVHYGRLALEDHASFSYRIAARRLPAILAVNRPLAEWSSRRLGVPENRVWYVPNSTWLPDGPELAAALPGVPDQRIVCVANFRPEKDHLTLIRAMALVVEECPQAHLLLVGAVAETSSLNAVYQEIARLNLGRHVTVLGQRTDVASILRSCTVGVLSSKTEGLPMALLEYGAAGLPTAATEVGHCCDILDNGRAGLLVPPASPERLSKALITLLHSRDLRKRLGENFRLHVKTEFSAEAVMRQICDVYETVLRS